MDKISETIKYMEFWKKQTSQLLEELAAVEMSTGKGEGSDDPEQESNYDKVFQKCSRRVPETKKVIKSWQMNIPGTEDDPNNIQAAHELLRIGALLFDTSPEDARIDQLLAGTNHFLEIVINAYAGIWHEPLTILTNLNLISPIREALFFYNGIPTIGELQHALRTGREFTNFSAVNYLKCQSALMNHGYSIFPILDNKKYWVQFSDRIPELWKCIINGQEAIYIRLDHAQAAALTRYPCLAKLQDGGIVAKLAV